MNNTQNLTQISLQLLPVAKILEYSSYSLLSASSVVEASDLEFKVRLAKEYGHLLKHTRTLGIGLSDFGVDVEMLMKNFSLHLKLTLERIYEIVAETNARRANPLWEMVTHTTTLTSGACSVLSVFHGLDLWASIACSASLFLSTQGHCYLLSKAENTPPTHNSFLHTFCAPTQYFDPASIGLAAKEQLYEEAQMLVDQFSNLVSAMSDQIEVLLQRSHQGREQAFQIHRHYEIISQLRRDNAKSIIYGQSTLSVKAQSTLTWPEWFAGRRHGPQGDEKYDWVRLDGQWRDLRELESIHLDANFYLKAAIDVLGNMRV
ncbi:hypothetical protein IFR05_008298 [Cadophora sp. M221]|nr:hypothetical protein IFR05_008298 [Cadophora sp. M221]